MLITSECNESSIYTKKVNSKNWCIKYENVICLP